MIQHAVVENGPKSAAAVTLESPLWIAVFLAALLAPQVGLGQDSSPRDTDLAGFSITGKIHTFGTDVMPSGKFRALSVNFDVVSAGATCSGSAHLVDETGQSIDFENSTGTVELAAGKATFGLQFEGAKIARHGGNTPLVISGLTLVCSGPSIGIAKQLNFPRKFQTTNIRSSEFDDSVPDFEFVMPGNPIPAASAVAVEVRSKGAFHEPIEITAHSSDARIAVTTQFRRACSGGPWCWQQFGTVWLLIEDVPELGPGSYPVTLTGKAGGKVHSFTLNLVVSIDPDRRFRENIAAMRTLKTEEAVTPNRPESVPETGTHRDLHPDATFSTQVTLRKMHAVLVLHRSGGMATNEVCEMMLAAATRFSRLFAEDRDSLAVISYGSTAEVRLSLTSHFLADAPQRISQIKCTGSANPGEALEAAQRELARDIDPEAINAVILLANGNFHALTANWPFQLACGSAARPCPPPACTESQNGLVPGIVVPWVNMAQLEGTMIPADFPETDGAHLPINRTTNSCFGQVYSNNLPYIPEQDINGVSVVGKRPLDRITSGPDAGKISPDQNHTLESAIGNQVDNILRQIRTNPASPTVVYVIGFHGLLFPTLDDLRSLANDPLSSSFDATQIAGLAIDTLSPVELMPAFQRVREDLIRRATVK